MDMDTLLKNRLAFPPEELAKYANKYVAWSPDSTRIIASDADDRRLNILIKELGYDPSEILVSSVPDQNETILGGGVIGGCETSPNDQTQSSGKPGNQYDDLSEFDRNRLAFPLEELVQYRGRYIAWSPDGTRIIASDENDGRLDTLIKELGYDPGDILVSPVLEGDSYIA
jgi:Tol biopolymer transport system component